MASLSKTWVRLKDVPAIMRNKFSLLAFGELIGAGLGPVRSKIWCRASERMHGFIEIFPADKAFWINVSVEG